MNRTKARKKATEPIKMTNKWNESNKIGIGTNEPNKSARKAWDMFLEFIWTWKWMNKMEKRRELMWLEFLEMNTPLEGWRLQDKCRCRHLRILRSTQDETRRGEDKSHSITHQFGRGSLLKISNLYYKDSSPPFIEGWPIMSVQEAYKGSYPKVPCTSPTSSAYSEVWRVNY